MTTVITRAYTDEQSANGIRERLYRQGFPRHQMTVVSANGADMADILRRLKHAMVPDNMAGTYAERIQGGASVVVVRATYKPLGAVRLANETFMTSGALDVGIPVQQTKISTPVDKAPSVLKDHPRFFTTAPRKGRSRGSLSDQLGLRKLSPHKARSSAMSGGKMMLGGKVKTGRVSNSAMSPGRHMSRAFWPTSLLSSRKRDLSVIEGGGHPFSRLLGWPTLS